MITRMTYWIEVSFGDGILSSCSYIHFNFFCQEGGGMGPGSFYPTTLVSRPLSPPGIRTEYLTKGLQQFTELAFVRVSLSDRATRTAHLPALHWLNPRLARAMFPNRTVSPTGDA